MDYDDDATTITAFATTGQVFVLVKIIGAWINIRLVTQWFLVVVYVLLAKRKCHAIPLEGNLRCGGSQAPILQ